MSQNWLQQILGANRAAGRAILNVPGALDRAITGAALAGDRAVAGVTSAGDRAINSAAGGIGGSIMNSFGAANQVPGRMRSGGRAGAPAPRSRAAALPASARVITQYPDGVSTGMGGGNAGPSQASQWAPAAASPVNRPAPRSAPGMGAPVTYGDSAARTRASAVATAAQQAGLPPQTAPTLSSQMSSDISSWLSANQGRANASGLEQWMRANANAERSKADRMNIVERFLAKERAAGRMGGGESPLTTDQAILRGQGMGALDDFKGKTSDEAILHMMGKDQATVDNIFGRQAAPPASLDTDTVLMRAQAAGALDNFGGKTSDEAILHLMKGDQAAVDQYFANGQQAPGFNGIGNLTDPKENQASNLLEGFIDKNQLRKGWIGDPLGRGQRMSDDFA